MMTMNRIIVLAIVVVFCCMQFTGGGTAFGQNLSPVIRPAVAPAIDSDPPRVVIDEIQAIRSANENYSRLQIALDVVGSGMDNAAGLRVRLAKAIDDTGANLIEPSEEPLDLKFENFRPSSLRLKLPARKATLLKELSGKVEVLLSDRDPESTVKIEGFVGKPRLEVSDPILAANGITLTIMSQHEFRRWSSLQRNTPASEQAAGPSDASQTPADELVVVADDPDHRIVSSQFFDRKDNPIKHDICETSSLSLANGASRIVMDHRFDQKLPDTTLMRIVLATRKAVVEVPFSLRDVPLP